jgi:hypothetical protein
MTLVQILDQLAGKEAAAENSRSDHKTIKRRADVIHRAPEKQQVQ